MSDHEHYDEMDTDERIAFLKHALHVVGSLDDLDVDMSRKPAMLAVWAFSETRNSLLNFQTHFEIDRESCIDEVIRHGVLFLRTLVEVVETAELPEGIPDSIVDATYQRSRQIAWHLVQTSYRPTVAAILEQLFERQQQQSEGKQR